MDEFAIRPLCPTPRSRIQLVRKHAHGNRDGDAFDTEKGELAFPVETGGGNRRVRQPAKRDVVEDVVSRKAGGFSGREARDALVETSGLACFSIGYDLKLCDAPKLFEDLVKVSFSDGERNISNVEFHRVIRLYPIASCRAVPVPVLVQAFGARKRVDSFKGPGKSGLSYIARGWSIAQSSGWISEIPSEKMNIFNLTAVEGQNN